MKLSIRKKNQVPTHLSTPKTKETIEALWRLQKIVLNTLDFSQVVHQIVNGLLNELGYLNLGYRIIVLTLADEEKKVLKRIALSSTKEAQRALKASAIPFEEIEIPLSSNNNLLIKTYKNKRPYITHEWPNIFTPVLTPEQAINNQQAAGIKTSLTYPVIVNDKSIGVLIFSLVKAESEVSEEEKELIRGFTDIVGLAVQNAQLYSSVEDNRKNLRLANTRLKQLDKLKDEFVSFASHELRTPLTVIKSYLSLLREEREGVLNEKQRLYVQRAYDATNRLNRLVTEMLDVSRIESGRLILNPKDVNIEVVVQNIVNEMQPKAQEQNVTLSVKSEVSESDILYIDEERISEVLVNLIGNALKYNHENGSVQIEIKRVDKDVIISVIDSGIGIKKSDLGKLFQKFGVVGGDYAHKNNIPSTGLGLYLSKTIIDRHSGKIWAESKGEGKGSTFSFSLPLENKKIV